MVWYYSRKLDDLLFIVVGISCLLSECISFGVCFHDVCIFAGLVPPATPGSSQPLFRSARSARSTRCGSCNHLPLLGAVYSSQAIARIFRYGQSAPTFVYRLLYDGTMEHTLYRWGPLTSQPLQGGLLPLSHLERAPTFLYRLLYDGTMEHTKYRWAPLEWQSL